MSNAEAEDETPELVGPAPLDFRGDLQGVLLADTSLNLSTIASERGGRQGSHRRWRQRVNVRVVGHQAAGDELRDERLTETLDVHGRTGREVFEAPLEPCRTRVVLAPPHDLVLRPV